MKGWFAAAAYAACSVSMVLLNKSLFQVFNFHYPFTLFVVQIILSICVMGILGLLGWIQLPRYNWRVALKLLPMSFCWWLYGVTGVCALRYLNVPMFGAVRRLTPLVVMAGEALFLRKYPPKGKTISATVMSLAAGSAAFTDPTYNATGYMWVTVCILATAAYLVLISKLGKPSNLSNLGLLWYNNLNAFPVMVASWYFSDELSSVLLFPQLKNFDFLFAFFFTNGQALLLNYLIFLCTLVNSPLTTAITGNVKDLVSTLVGLFAFNDVVRQTDNLTALGLACLSGIGYSYYSYQEAQQKKAESEKRDKQN